MSNLVTLRQKVQTFEGQFTWQDMYPTTTFDQVREWSGSDSVWNENVKYSKVVLDYSSVSRATSVSAYKDGNATPYITQPITGTKEVLRLPYGEWKIHTDSSSTTVEDQKLTIDIYQVYRLSMSATVAKLKIYVGVSDAVVTLTKEGGSTVTIKHEAKGWYNTEINPNNFGTYTININATIGGSSISNKVSKAINSAGEWSVDSRIYYWSVWTSTKKGSASTEYGSIVNASSSYRTIKYTSYFLTKNLNDTIPNQYYEIYGIGDKESTYTDVIQTGTGAVGFTTDASQHEYVTKHSASWAISYTGAYSGQEASRTDARMMYMIINEDDDDGTGGERTIYKMTPYTSRKEVKTTVDGKDVYTDYGYIRFERVGRQTYKVVYTYSYPSSSSTCVYAFASDAYGTTATAPTGSYTSTSSTDIRTKYKYEGQYKNVQVY